MEFCMLKLVYNLGHNILEIYNVLVEIRLTTSKAKRGFQYRKLSILDFSILFPIFFPGLYEKTNFWS